MGIQLDHCLWNYQMEMWNAKNKTVIGKLVRALYGTRDAPQIWQGEITKTLKRLGYEESPHHPGVYGHVPDNGVRVMAYVDDLLIIGPRSPATNLVSELKRRMIRSMSWRVGEMKMKTMFLTWGEAFPLRM